MSTREALAKGCSESRKRSLGYEHRIAEAARALATATTKTSDSAVLEAIGEALQKVEEHLLFRFAVAAKYGMEEEVRNRMLQKIVESCARKDDRPEQPRPAACRSEP